MKQLQLKLGKFECQENNETNLTYETVATILSGILEGN